MPLFFLTAVVQSLGLLIFSLLPKELSARTDIVGFPIHANFNINRYYQFYVIELAVPVLALLLYQLRYRKTQSAVPLHPPTPSMNIGKFRFPEWLSQMIFWMTPLSFLLLKAVADRTYAIEPNDLKTFYPWLSWPSTIALISGAYFFLKIKLSKLDFQDRCTQALKLIVFPILLFFIYAKLPGPRSWIHLYHDGESLVPSYLLQKGLFPWKDILFTHGLLQDPIMSWVGHRLFDQSVWGSDAGIQLILIPLFFIANYFLSLRLFKSNHWVILVYAVALPALFPLYFSFNLRFLFFPLLLLLLASYFERHSRLWSLLFGATLTLAVFLTPELVLFASCVGLILICHSFFQKQYRSLFLFMLLGALLVILPGTAYLHSHGAFLNFLRVYTDEGLHYRFESGLPVPFHLGTWFTVALLIPWVAYFLGCYYFFRCFTDKILTSVDWMVLCYHLFSILYFGKFLCRPDTHILAHTAIALPLLVYFLLPRLQAYPKSTAAGCILMLFLSLSPLKKNWVENHFTIKVPEHSHWQRFGYRKANPVAEEILTDLNAVFTQVLAPNEPIFDFTNEPALFHYLLERPAATRYTYVILAATQKSQLSLVEELESAKPKLVVYSSQLDYASWDGVPGMVRHYEVSRYLLANYKPFVAFKHHVILQRKDLNLSYSGPNILPIEASYLSEACDWGYAPHFLRLAPIDGDKYSLPFTTRKMANGYITEIQISPERLSEATTLEIDFLQSQSDQFSLIDGTRDPGELRDMILFKTLKKAKHAYSIPVSSCIQWTRYSGSKLYLSHREPQQILTIQVQTTKSKAVPLSGFRS